MASPALAKQVLGAAAKQERTTAEDLRECRFTADEEERKDLIVALFTKPATQSVFDQGISDQNSDPDRGRHRCEMVAGIGTSAYFCPAVRSSNSFAPSTLRVLARQTDLAVIVVLSYQPQAAFASREREAAILVAKQVLQQA